MKYYLLMPYISDIRRYGENASNSSKF